LLAHGRWFSPGTPASSTTKTGRHDIAEILLKVALNTINQSSLCFRPYDELPGLDYEEQEVSDLLQVLRQDLIVYFFVHSF
jgi:hypothetical protein